eukprot:CAMPEP_0174825948 /NCGR_PEP_ID=MMETSP1107-20130205/43323_1 /TAXON_ID=36770 /ORGANISM="Paraphysomonas vestita, Strain GFlagA" /LENGTH=142 /DNA_ID=CAMNT_0016058177 /DNA_START=673 /DNA_END=1098 /DNA_ORIENTATION=+
MIEKDAELLGKHANQAKLLDPTQATYSIARHLRSIWEVIYFRASGGIELPPAAYSDMLEEPVLPSLILKDSIAGFGQYCSDPESEEDEDDDEDEDEEGDENVNVEFENSQDKISDENSSNKQFNMDEIKSDSDNDDNTTPRW